MTKDTEYYAMTVHINVHINDALMTGPYIGPMSSEVSEVL